MQVLCDRFFRFMAGELPVPGSTCQGDCPCCRPGVPDQIRNPNPAITVSKQVQPRDLGDHRLQPLYPL